MNDKRISIFGEQDQELLFRAFAQHIANITRKSVTVTTAMIHSCLHDAIIESNITVTESRKLDESKRLELLEGGIDTFLNKTKPSHIQKREIKNGCMIIYNRWRELRAKLRDESEILLDEILDNETSQIVGYDDQEVLFTAITHYIVKTTGRDRIATAKLMRICMLEVTIPRRINLKEARYLEETERLEMITEGIQEYFKKSRISESQSKILLADCLKIYERWKEIRRIDPARDEYKLVEILGKEI